MKNSARTVSASLLCATLLWATNTFATVQSTFDLTGEGWRDLTYTNLGIFHLDNGLANFDALFGNPAGSVDTTDPGDDFAARFGAPAGAGYLGDLTAFIGGAIAFELIIKANDGPIPSPAVPGVVAFENSVMNRGIGYTGPKPNAADWTQYSALLLPAPGIVNPFVVGFWGAYNLDNPFAVSLATAADFTNVLGNVTRLTINGEVTDGTDDTIALDNVHLTMIPIPATLPLLASTLFGLGFVARRCPR